MSNVIPDTNDLNVAIVATALHLSQVPRDGAESHVIFFEDRLTRFLTAYKTIVKAVAFGSNGTYDNIDVNALMEQVKTELKEK